MIKYLLNVFIVDFIFLYLELIIFVLIGVAFLTLLERKVLRYTQLRVGPNKLGLLGILQPFSDGVKLFSKEEINPIKSNFFMFWISPSFGFSVSLLLWSLYVCNVGFLDFEFRVLFFLCCVAVGVYGLIFSGWSSNSKYSLLGSLRAVAQTISYEIVIAFIFLFIGFTIKSFRLLIITQAQSYFFFLFFCMPLTVILLIVVVVETNRAPFDLAEGESELVSGFNVEYGGLKFALIFLAEYGRIIWICIVVSFCFASFSKISLIVSTLVLIVIFLFFRSSYPRLRYDFLIGFVWKKALPSILILYFFVLLFI